MVAKKLHKFVQLMLNIPNIVHPFIFVLHFSFYLKICGL